MWARLVGAFTLLSPLSHIGDSHSTTSYLAQAPIVQPDGDVAEVFCYAGNALRGMWRDAAADYLLDALGSPVIPLGAFHLLYAGGSLGGDSKVDVAEARRYRQAVPLVALWGGGIGAQILPGKMRVSQCWPVCREAAPVLPDEFRQAGEALSYQQLTYEWSSSRMDDAKDPRLAGRLAPAAGQMTLLGEAEPAKGRKADGPAQQMRTTAELLAAGTVLTTRIDLLDVSALELGCLVSAIHRWSRSPYLGGKSGSGHGLARLTYSLLNLDTGEVQPFLRVDGEGPALLAPAAQAAKDAYDQHLRAIYDAFLRQEQPEIVALLGAR